MLTPFETMKYREGIRKETDILVEMVGMGLQAGLQPVHCIRQMGSFLRPAINRKIFLDLQLLAAGASRRKRKRYKVLAPMRSFSVQRWLYEDRVFSEPVFPVPLVNVSESYLS